MNFLIRRYRLLRLKWQEMMLQAQFEHAEGLMADHKRRYHVLAHELGAVRRRIAALEEPQVLLRRVA